MDRVLGCVVVETLLFLSTPPLFPSLIRMWYSLVRAPTCKESIASSKTPGSNTRNAWIPSGRRRGPHSHVHYDSRWTPSFRMSTFFMYTSFGSFFFDFLSCTLYYIHGISFSSLPLISLSFCFPFISLSILSPSLHSWSSSASLCLIFSSWEREDGLLDDIWIWFLVWMVNFANFFHFHCLFGLSCK